MFLSQKSCLHSFELKKIEKVEDLSLADAFDGTTIFIVQQDDIFVIGMDWNTDFFVSMHPKFGSIVVAKGIYIRLSQKSRAAIRKKKEQLKIVQSLTGFE